MERAQKEEIVAALRQIFETTNLVVITQFSQLTVSDASDLRRRMTAAGARFRVIKNRLAKRALEGTRFGPMAELFSGSTAIAYSSDPVAAAKVTVEYARISGKLVVLGGALGTDMLDAPRVKALAGLPSLDELRGQLVGLLQTPASRLVRVLQEPGSQVARVLAAYAETEQPAQAAQE